MKNLKLFCTALLVHLFFSCKTGKRDFRPIIKDQIEEIIGGDAVPIKELPWQVGLLEPEQDINCFCGGSIINQKWILTAAHCLYYYKYDGTPIRKRKVDEVYIFANSEDLKRGGEIYDVEEIFIKPDYNPKTFDNDIALLRLKSPINLKHKNQVISIPNSIDQYTNLNRPGNNLYVSGWGSISTTGDLFPNYLQRALVEIKDHSICTSNYAAVSRVVTENMICASGYNTDICQADSGGPLYTVINGRGLQLGIVSWAVGCAREDFYGVYTNVFNYVDWIKTKCEECIQTQAVDS